MTVTLKLDFLITKQRLTMNKIYLSLSISLLMSCNNSDKIDCNYKLLINDNCYVCMKLPDNIIYDEHQAKEFYSVIEIPTLKDTSAILFRLDSITSLLPNQTPMLLLEDYITRAFSSDEPPEYERINGNYMTSIIRIYKSRIDQSYYGGIYLWEENYLLSVNCYHFSTKSDLIEILTNTDLILGS